MNTPTTAADTLDPQDLRRAYFEGVSVNFQRDRIPPRGHPAWDDALFARLTAHALRSGNLAVLIGHGTVDAAAGFLLETLPLVCINAQSPARRVWQQAADFVVFAKGIPAFKPGPPIAGLEHIRALHQVAFESRSMAAWLRLGRMAQAIANGLAENNAARASH